MGHKWVTSGSHPDYSMGHWVKWVNRCDPLSTLMSGVVRWFKSGGVALTKFTPLKGRDEGEGEDDHEARTAIAPQSPQGDLDGTIILCYVS